MVGVCLLWLCCWPLLGFHQPVGKSGGTLQDEWVREEEFSQEFSRLVCLSLLTRPVWTPPNLKQSDISVDTKAEIALVRRETNCSDCTNSKVLYSS